MQSISDLLKNRQIKNKKSSERAEVIKEIYAIYTSPLQRKKRKIENWKRYVNWCKVNKKENSTENQNKFRKTKFFLKEYPVKTICYFISHIPTKDLYYLKSIAKDMENRQENFSSYLLSSIKVK